MTDIITIHCGVERFQYRGIWFYNKEHTFKYMFIKNSFIVNNNIKTKDVFVDGCMFKKTCFDLIYGFYVIQKAFKYNRNTDEHIEHDYKLHKQIYKELEFKPTMKLKLRDNKVCPVCCKHFIAASNRITCSYECRDARRISKAMVKVSCVSCKAEFQIKRGTLADRKKKGLKCFCEECISTIGKKYSHIEEGKYTHCAECGKLVSLRTARSFKKTKLCSVDCKENYRSKYVGY